MPKKTREEKILARLRRLEQSNETITEVSEPSAPTSSGYSLKNISPPTKSTPITSTSTEVDYSYVRSDLKKIAILTVAALLIEVALSLTASEWYAKLFPRLF
jgi:hypothetical protein